MSWQPELADPRIEKAMELKSIPENDRDEVRRFAEFLRRLKQPTEDRGPLRPEMKAFILGEPTDG